VNEATDDEAEVDDETLLWRRVPSWPDWTVFDENLGRVRPSSIAFDDNKNGTSMSAFLEGYGNTVEDILRNHESFFLAAVSVGFVRSHDLTVVHDPLEGLPSHVEVRGAKTKRVRSALAKAAVWIVPPPDVDRG
jgi:hypothetical protein